MDQGCAGSNVMAGNTKQENNNVGRSVGKIAASLRSLQ
jgi:hypothetical protein